MIWIVDDIYEEGWYLIIVVDFVVFYVVLMYKGIFNILLCIFKWVVIGVDFLFCYVWVFVKLVGKGILFRLGKVIKKY